MLVSWRIDRILMTLLVVTGLAGTALESFADLSEFLLALAGQRGGRQGGGREFLFQNRHFDYIGIHRGRAPGLPVQSPETSIWGLRGLRASLGIAAFRSV